MFPRALRKETTTGADEFKAGARIVRRLLARMQSGEGGSAPGEGPDEFQAFDYGAMGPEIRSCLYAVHHDGSSEVVNGFCAGLAVYLHVGLCGCALGANDLTTWDPVPTLMRPGAGFDLRPEPMLSAPPTAPLLFEHDDGRDLVAHSTSLTIAGNPKWHRVGPVEIEASPR